MPSFEDSKFKPIFKTSKKMVLETDLKRTMDLSLWQLLEIIIGKCMGKNEVKVSTQHAAQTRGETDIFSYKNKGVSG